MSCTYGYGVSKPATCPTGAVRESKTCSWMTYATSPMKLLMRGASLTSTARPVFSTLLSTRSLSQGTSERRSMTSTLTPSAAKASAAFSRSGMTPP